MALRKNGENIKENLSLQEVSQGGGGMKVRQFLNRGRGEEDGEEKRCLRNISKAQINRAIHQWI